MNTEVEEDEDVGIGVDFDQCSQEATFYAECIKLRASSSNDDKGDFERADSAVCLNSATRESFPAKLQNLNGSREVNSKRTFEEYTVKRTNAFKKEMQKYSKTTDSNLLSHQRLSTHLIDFIDIPLNKNLRRRFDADKLKTPLFSMTETGLDICSDYFFPIESSHSKIELSYLRTLSENLSKSHRKLKEIVDFVDLISEKSKVAVPMLIRVLHEWAIEFLRDHTLRLDELRAKRLVDPFQVLSNLKPICDNIEIVRLVIGEDSNRQIWMWEGIEISWNRIFLITQRESIMDRNNELIRQLQTKLVQTLIQTMDHIFETGRVPVESRHFVLHNDPKHDAELLLCRNIEMTHSLLWDEQLIEIVLEAAKCRVRLGIIEFPQQTFSRKYLEVCGENGNLIDFYQFRNGFMATCEELNSCFAQELFETLHTDNRFLNLWNDFENVVIGQISFKYASTVFRSDSNVVNFSDAFWLASRERMTKENMSRFSWIPTKSEFSVTLDKLMSSFISTELIDVMNQCMRFSHSAYRTRELLITMSNDRNLMSRMTCPQSFLDVHGGNNQEFVNRVLRKRMRFFVFTMEKIVSHFQELFAEMVKHVFKNVRESIIKAERLRDVEQAVRTGFMQLTALITRSGMRKPVHEGMDMFKLITDEMRLRSVSNTLDLSYLQMCENDVRRVLNNLVNFGKKWGNDNDSIFHHLSVRLGHLNMGNEELK